MTIKVKLVSNDHFSVYARATQNEGGEEWSPLSPLDGKTIVEELMKRGFHIQDIVDAMVEADPNWLGRQKKGNSQ